MIFLREINTFNALCTIPRSCKCTSPNKMSRMIGEAADSGIPSGKCESRIFRTDPISMRGEINQTSMIFGRAKDPRHSKT